jgi:hypothetical protein
MAVLADFHVTDAGGRDIDKQGRILILVCTEECPMLQPPSCKLTLAAAANTVVPWAGVGKANHGVSSAERMIVFLGRILRN